MLPVSDRQFNLCVWRTQTIIRQNLSQRVSDKEKFLPGCPHAMLMRCGGKNRYVEMLEQQQQQLVGGLQVLYDIVINEKGWKGAPLKKSKNGYPLTHDILERLRVLKTDSDMDIEEGGFEEDLEALRKRLAAKGDGLAQTDSTESDYHSQTTYPDRQSPQDLFTDIQFSHLNHLPPTAPRQYLQDQRCPSTNHTNSVAAHQENPRRSLDGAMLQPNQRSSSWVVQHSQDPSYEDPLEYVPYQHDHQAYRCHLPAPSNPGRLTSLWPN